MKLERSIKLALKYLCRAEQIAHDNQKGNKNTRRSYELMEHSLASARQETQAANYIATILEAQERQ